MSVHPTSEELFGAAEHNATDATDRHIASCVRCQVHISRLRELSLHSIEPSSATVSSLREASQAVAVSTIDPHAVEPAAGEVWRTRAPASLLLWVRRRLDSDTVDAIPVTLDPSLADDVSLVVGPDGTPWGCVAVLLADYRTHVHVGALAAKVGSLDVAADVQRLLDGSLNDIAVRGEPILDLSDQRLEYRDHLRFALGDFAPSVWVESHPATPHFWDVPREDLSLRLDGIEFIEWPGLARRVGPAELVPSVKCAYLGSVVLVCRLSDPDVMADTELLIEACRSVVAEETDAEAVAVFAAEESQGSVVVRRADMRPAIGLPSGEPVQPGPYLSDLPLVDILFKHFDRYALEIPWSGVPMPDAARRDIDVLASEHVRASAVSVAAKGRAAHQVAKKVGYARAADNPSAVEEFVRRVARGDLEGALQALIEDEDR